MNRTQYYDYAKNMILFGSHGPCSNVAGSRAWVPGLSLLDLEGQQKEQNGKRRNRRKKLKQKRKEKKEKGRKNKNRFDEVAECKKDSTKQPSVRKEGDIVSPSTRRPSKEV
ncbi:hypothetical protein AK88_05400 [Plasmodium fragile]|uniref:Uncharacterized protein n=1 Tax=Plasmodium fragile TaxID=5857 RepID=A0A0D9QGW0_PLAFR|nr:uncharacterized protein AK88_05400 [Plasmodium fragile]KJP84961.1 hypothetical protein AK88_05400 [Plasmodium fragile]